MATHHQVPLCSWIGVTDDPEREVPCEKPARWLLVDATGMRHFACDEHVGEVRARAGGGEAVRDAQRLDDIGRTIPSPGSAVEWG